jgi:hypothetical protein
MTRMVGTGNAPQGYAEGQMFDVPEHDQGTVEDLERRGWATRVDPRDDIGHSKVGVAAAIVRGDMLSDPVDAEIAAEIGSVEAALPIVHSGDPDATTGDYDAEVAAGKRDFYGNPIEAEGAIGHVSVGKPKETAAEPPARRGRRAKAEEPKAEESAEESKAEESAEETPRRGRA